MPNCFLDGVDSKVLHTVHLVEHDTTAKEVTGASGLDLRAHAPIVKAYWYQQGQVCGLLFSENIPDIV